MELYTPLTLGLIVVGAIIAELMIMALVKFTSFENKLEQLANKWF